MGTVKIAGRGGTKIVIGWGVKIWPQGGGQLHETRRGREGELSKKNKENVNFGQKLSIF